MNGFVAPPRKTKKIPAVTLADLAEALALYLPTISDYQHRWWDFESDRQDRTTTILLSGKSKAITHHEVRAIIDVYEKAATSKESRISSEPFVVHVTSGELIFTYDEVIKMSSGGSGISLMIVPQEDGSIAIS